MQLSFKRSSGQFSKYSDSGPKILVYKYHEIDFWCNKIDRTILAVGEYVECFFFRLETTSRNLIKFKIRSLFLGFTEFEER